MRGFQSTKLLVECAEWLEVPSYTLQKCVPTRWWSDVTMLRSLLRNRRAMEAQVMKNEAPVPDKIKKLDWEMIELVLSVMEPFAVATETMEADKHPTIGFVLGMVCLLRKEIDKLMKHDNPAIRAAALDMSIDFNQR